MGMLSGCINLELLQQFTTQDVLGKHAFDCLFKRHCGMRRRNLLVRLSLHATWITTVVVILLIGSLLAGKLHFLSVYNDNEVTGVNVRGKGRLVLTTKQDSYVAC